MPSHVYVFPLTVVTCECFVTFFLNLAGRMHDLGAYEKQKKCGLIISIVLEHGEERIIRGLIFMDCNSLELSQLRIDTDTL